MRKWIAISIILLSITAFSEPGKFLKTPITENWFYLGETKEGHKYYLDLDSIKKKPGDEIDGPRVRVNMKTIYAGEEIIETMKVKEEIVKVWFDCESETHLIIQMRFYDKDNKLINIWNSPQADYSPITNNESFVKMVFNRVCK